MCWAGCGQPWSTELIVELIVQFLLSPLAHAASWVCFSAEGCGCQIDKCALIRLKMKIVFFKSGEKCLIVSA